MSAEKQRLGRIIREHGDIPRPVRWVPVLDNSMAGPDAAGFVLGSIDGALTPVVYRDGEIPAVGALIQAYRMSHRGDSGWLARPITEPRITRSTEVFLFAAFDMDTHDQFICGKRNDNTYEIRGVNPVASNSTDLLPHLVRHQYTDALGNTRTPHICYGFPDWQPGENGKSVGANLYVSTDDGATWTSVPGFSGMLDIGAGVGSSRLALYDGGTTLTTLDAGGLIVDRGGRYDLPLSNGYNRIVRAYQIGLSGTTQHFYQLLANADGIWAEEYNRDTITNVITHLGVTGPGAWPLAGGVPWEELRRQAGTVQAVSSPSLNQIYLLLRPEPGADLYRASYQAALAGSWTSLYAATNNPPVQTAAYLAAGGTRSFRRFNWNGTRPWIEVNVSGSLVVSGQRAVIDGSEAVFGGAFPVVSVGFTPGPETIYKVLSTGLESQGAVRTLYVIMGPLPGEGSDPAFASQRVVAIYRDGAGTLTYLDESDRLDIDGHRLMMNASLAIDSRNLGYGVHWWDILPL